MSAALLTFEPVRHEYRRPDGQLVPSVTQILRATGVSVDFEALRASSGRLADAIDEKRDIGTAVHADAHAYDDDDLDWSTVDPRVEPYLQAWVTFRQSSGVTPISRERRVYHPTLQYGGTLDGIFRTPAGKTVLIDIKCGDPAAAGCRYQTAAYQLAWLLEHPEHVIHERWGVWLKATIGTARFGRTSMPYQVSVYDDWRDGDTWRAIVTTYYAQAARREEARRG